MFIASYDAPGLSVRWWWNRRHWLSVQPSGEPFKLTSTVSVAEARRAYDDVVGNHRTAAGHRALGVIEGRPL